MDATTILGKLVRREDLTADEARGFLTTVLQGGTTPAQIGALLTSLAMKGETADEIAGLALAMRDAMVHVDAPHAFDIVGTGGDKSGTFNISTASAFVIAGAGVPVAKHGNRAASSKCGSADVLEALGVQIELTPEHAARVFKDAGIVFLFASRYHPAMKHVGPIRKELGFRTVFNILGPLANPAGTRRQMTGVADLMLAEKMAQASLQLGYERMVIVASEDGLDEISTNGNTHVFDVCEGKVTRSTIDPTVLGIARATREDILGANATENATIIKDILAGKPGPKRDIVVLNSACGLYAAGVAETIKDGLAKAADSIDTGAAAKALERLVRESQGEA